MAAAGQKNVTQQLLEMVTANNEMLKQLLAEQEKMRTELKALTVTCTQTRESVEANKLQAGTSRTAKKATSTTEAAKKPDFPVFSRWMSTKFTESNYSIPDRFTEFITEDMYAEVKDIAKKANPAKNEKALLPFVVNSLVSLYLTKGNKQFNSSAYAGMTGLYEEDKKAYENS